MSGTTSRLALPYFQGTDLVSSIAATDQSAMTILDNATTFTQGTLAARPAAGFAGRIYRATDVTTPGTANGALYFDNGTSWYQVGTDTEPAFSTYKTIHGEGSTLASGTAAATYYTANAGLAGTGAAATTPTGVFYSDPTWLNAGTRATKLRLVAALGTSTAQTATFTFGLYPVSSVGPVTGGGGQTGVVLGTVVSGSTAAFVAPGANSAGHAESTDFTHPGAGFYVMAVVVSVAAVAAGNTVFQRVALQFRQV